MTFACAIGLQLFGGNGQEIDLSTTLAESGGAPYVFLGSTPQIFGAPSANLTRRAAPEGAKVTSSRWGPNRVALDVVVHARTRLDLLDALRYWEEATAPVGPECRLLVNRPDGTSRELVARKLSEPIGLEHPYSQRWKRLRTIWQADAPFWRDTTAYTVGTSIGVGGEREPGGRVWSPALGWAPAEPWNTTVIGEAGATEVSIDYSGEVEAHPIFKITGPTTHMHLVNRSTSKSIALVGDLPTGEFLTVDTRPQSRTPLLLNNSTNARGWLREPSDFWGLVPGPNQISLELRGGIFDESAVEISWQALHLTP